MTRVAILFTILSLVLTISVGGQTFTRQQALKVATATQYLVPNSSIMSVEPTGSMKPMMDENCLVVLLKEPFTEIRENDVIVYKSLQNRYIVHRVISKKRDGRLWTRGDNNTRWDNEYVTDSNYIGKVISIVYFHESVKDDR